MDTKSKAKSTTSHDVEVGQRIRARRMAKGMSQTELGTMLGVTFQQVQKYEKGVNRVGAGRLVRVGEALDVPVSFFFGATDTGSEDARVLAHSASRGAARRGRSGRKHCATARRSEKRLIVR
jgi:transcriptional regulator with XRE-family HTH domain